MRVTKGATERKNELIKAASILFMENGFKNTSVDMIVKKINVAKGLFYYYFESKESLLRCIEDEFMTDFEKGLNDILKGKCSDIKDMISVFIGYYLSTIEKNLKLINLSAQASEGVSNLESRLKDSAKKAAYTFISKLGKEGGPVMTYPIETLTVLVSGFSDLYLSGIRDKKVFMTIITEIFRL